MNAQIGVDACIAVESAFEARLNLNIVWNENESDQVQSIVAWLQFYSDKSQTSMSADSYSFYHYK